MNNNNNTNRRNSDHRRRNNQSGPGARKHEPKVGQAPAEHQVEKMEGPAQEKPVHAILITEYRGGHVKVTPISDMVDLNEGSVYQPPLELIERILGDAHRILQTQNIASAAARLMAERMGGRQ